jgi:hypothetical protein
MTEEHFKDDLICEFCINQDINEEKFIEIRKHSLLRLAELAYTAWLEHKLWVLDDELKELKKEEEDGERPRKQVIYQSHPDQRIL